jgi:hypothetical protein
MASDTASKRRPRKPPLRAWVPLAPKQLIRWTPWIIERDPRFAGILRPDILDIIAEVPLVVQAGDILHRVRCPRPFDRSNPRPPEIQSWNTFGGDPLDAYTIAPQGWRHVVDGVLKPPSGGEYGIEIRWFRSWSSLNFKEWFEAQLYRWLHVNQPMEPMNRRIRESSASGATPTVHRHYHYPMGTAAETAKTLETTDDAKHEDQSGRSIKANAERNAETSDLDDCIDEFAARTGGKTDRDVLRTDGPKWLEERGIRTTGTALVSRYNDPQHKNKHRGHGERKNS